MYNRFFVAVIIVFCLYDFSRFGAYIFCSFLHCLRFRYFSGLFQVRGQRNFKRRCLFSFDRRRFQSYFWGFRHKYTLSSQLFLVFRCHLALFYVSGCHSVLHAYCWCSNNRTCVTDTDICWVTIVLLFKVATSSLFPITLAVLYFVMNLWRGNYRLCFFFCKVASYLSFPIVKKCRS